MPRTKGTTPTVMLTEREGMITPNGCVRAATALYQDVPELRVLPVELLGLMVTSDPLV